MAAFGHGWIQLLESDLWLFPSLILLSSQWVVLVSRDSLRDPGLPPLPCLASGAWGRDGHLLFTGVTGGPCWLVT
jgi:hypothetical protein